VAVRIEGSAGADQAGSSSSDGDEPYDPQTVTVPVTLCLAIMVGYVTGCNGSHRASLNTVRLEVLMMEAVRTSETSVNSYQSTRRYNPEDGRLCTHRRDNLIPCYGVVLGSDVMQTRR
jgi:hypothetical protein